MCTASALWRLLITAIKMRVVAYAWPLRKLKRSRGDRGLVEKGDERANVHKGGRDTESKQARM